MKANPDGHPVRLVKSPKVKAAELRSWRVPMGRPMMVTRAKATLRQTLGVCIRAKTTGRYAQYTPQKMRMAQYNPKVCAAVGEKSWLLSETAAKKMVAQAHANDDTAETLPRNELSIMSACSLIQRVTHIPPAMREGCGI